MDRTAELIEWVVAEGLQVTPRHYPHADQKMQRDGAVDGFAACEGLDTDGLAELLTEAERVRDEKSAKRTRDAAYWKSRASEIRWVTNVVSADMELDGLTPIIPTSAMGNIKAWEFRDKFRVVAPKFR